MQFQQDPWDVSNMPFRPDSERLGASDLKQVLAQICPGHGYVQKDTDIFRNLSGCSVCPATAYTPASKGSPYIEYSIRGHFLGPRSDDLIVTLYGCEPHAANFRDTYTLSRS